MFYLRAWVRRLVRRRQGRGGVAERGFVYGPVAESTGSHSIPSAAAVGSRAWSITIRRAETLAQTTELTAAARDACLGKVVSLKRGRLHMQIRLLHPNSPKPLLVMDSVWHDSGDRIRTRRAFSGGVSVETVASELALEVVMGGLVP